MNSTGYTDEKTEYAEVCKWRDDAIADGWSHTATYDHEAEDRVCTLKKDGFTAMVITRELDSSKSKYKYNAEINAWGPDKLSVSLQSVIYNMSDLRAGLRRCNWCGANNVDAYMVGFAGRCCKPCLPKARKQLEYPGWTD